MAMAFDMADVPPVPLDALLVPMRAAIANGKGLALFNGLAESEIRELETILWGAMPRDTETRVAVALRFRALLDVFRARRLKQLFLDNGFKLIARAIAEASRQRLNAEFGFSAQKFVLALSSPPRTHRTLYAVRSDRAAA